MQMYTTERLKTYTYWLDKIKNSNTQFCFGKRSIPDLFLFGDSLETKEIYLGVK